MKAGQDLCRSSECRNNCAEPSFENLASLVVDKVSILLDKALADDVGRFCDAVTVMKLTSATSSKSP